MQRAKKKLKIAKTLAADAVSVKVFSEYTKLV